MGLYQLARKVNSGRKALMKAYAGTILSPVRRIERVYPPTGERVVSMTFDDGPDALVPEGHDRGLTEVILNVLSDYGARVTFDVIGSTVDNYPDENGAEGTFMWSGNAYDHYPKFGDDALAGAKNRPELIEKILAAGHEISNHGSTHRLFGKMRAVYGKRRHFETLEDVVEDLEDLHSYMDKRFGYTMRLGRPAHYIDRIPDGADAYDAYRIMGYNYMAASFDGAGWQPLDSYSSEVEAMVKPLEETLRCDPDSLNGKIIFQKDGCNMALRTPIADALPKQLEILKEFGYRVIPVSELLSISPFEDMDPGCREAESVKYLLGAGHAVGYKNNTFMGDSPIKKSEFYMMTASPDILRVRRHMTAAELCALAEEASSVKIKTSYGNSLLDAAMAVGVNADESLYKDKKAVRRGDAAIFIANMAKADII